jgi:hypothetical protein
VLKIAGRQDAGGEGPGLNAILHNPGDFMDAASTTFSGSLDQTA